MKKMMIALVAMLTIAATGKAMSYEQARNESFVPDRQDGLRAELDGRAI